MKCPRCNGKAKKCGEVDEHWYFYECRECKYEWANTKGERSSPRVRKPIIVCLCGSTRFGEAFRLAEFQETLSGKIVLTIGCNMRSDDDLFGHLNEAAREQIIRNLDELHLRKIDLAKEVLILNVGGYIGEGTSRELAYARGLGKTIRYLEIPQQER